MADAIPYMKRSSIRDRRRRRRKIRRKNELRNSWYSTQAKAKNQPGELQRGVAYCLIVRSNLPSHIVSCRALPFTVGSSTSCCDANIGIVLDTDIVLVRARI